MSVACFNRREERWDRDPRLYDRNEVSVMVQSVEHTLLFNALYR